MKVKVLVVVLRGRLGLWTDRLFWHELGIWQVVLVTLRVLYPFVLFLQ